MSGLAWRLLGRELRSGELRLLLAALVVAVAAVTAVGFFTDRVRLALEQEAQQLLGGDLLLISDHPWPAAIREEAARRGLNTAETVSFPSMVLAGGQTQLADIKAVSSAYPLRGSLRRADRAGEAGQATAGGPPPGTAWVDERLANVLDAGPGKTVQLGQRDLPVSAILTLEPDRGVNFFSLAPRLMIHLDDLPGTGLVQTGSRITYRFMVAGDAAAVAGFRTWIEPRLGRGERLEDTRNARPEIRNVLDRAQRFLGLATLLTVILAAVAVALAARRYMQRHLDACAVMRCLGITQAGLIRLHSGLFVWLALLAAALGCVAGFGVHFILVSWLAELLDLRLPLPGWLPPVQGAAVAAVLLFGFAFPPLLQLGKVPTLRVLRRELGPPQPFLLGGYALGVVALAGLLLLVAGDLRLGAYAIGGFAGALLAFWLVARASVRAISRLRGGAGFGWRQGLANLERHAMASTLQIVALALGLMAMLLLTVTRGELVAAWQKATPADAPNRFIVNIQPDQRQAVGDTLVASGITSELSPMIRGRLMRIGEQAVSAASYPDDERAQRLIEREFNLSWRAGLPPGNRVSAGDWFAPEDAGKGLASVEEGLARTLGIKIGDELRFVIGGKETTLRVSNLRKLDWDSMRVNFFVLTPPGVLDGAPASYITSFHLAENQATLARTLVERFPNLTLIDVGAILAQIQAVMGQVTRAVQLIFLFSLAAGAIVLSSALLTAFDERRYELSVMRALGAGRAQLRQALLAELAVVGAIAGLIAGAGAALVGSLLARNVFQLDLQPGLWLFPQAISFGVLLSVGIGWLAVRRLVATPPLVALRAGA
jgi:putative ABC transport system permease protein